MENSKFLAGIIGPTLIVMVASELKIWNPNLYDQQIVPLVYMSGVLIFIAGLSIVRRHNIWIIGWQLIITLLGWFSVFLGLSRMFFPQVYQDNFKNGLLPLIIETVLILFGIILTIFAYFPNNKNSESK